MKPRLSENLRLGIPRNDPVIRFINCLAVIFLLLVLAGNAFGADKATKEDPKAKLESAQQQIAQLQATNQYLAVLAERNEMAVRLLQANAHGEDLQKQLDAANAKIADLQKKIDDASKPAPDAK